MERPLTIGDLAGLTDTKVETMRYYERLGLLPAPARTSGNYRSYEPSHVGRLSFVRRARDLGFSLDQVRDLLGLADQKDSSCESVDAIARAHLAEVERKLADLKGLRRELDALISQCRQGTIAQCRILEALAPRDAESRSDRPLPAARARKAAKFRNG
jgi:DNA-binding transcriptional MerR regulator